MSKYSGCGLAYIDGYDTSYMDEDIYPEEEEIEFDPAEGWDDEDFEYTEWPEEFYD